MDSKLIGKYLQQKRKEKDFTQKDLADIMGVTFQAVSRWEKGDSIPDLDSLDNLAKFYKVSIDEILQRDLITNLEGLPVNFLISYYNDCFCSLPDWRYPICYTFGNFLYR